ncbi:hypothetical protein GCM10023187_32110 [Nibrella viscosa]|uniref:Uncharacterized protein n=2 Tax=Nibrella viscosa TaxID=1084524 RepID=A0ABP8KLF7_9BACT
MALTTAVGLALFAILTIVANVDALIHSDSLQRLLGIVPATATDSGLDMGSREGAYAGTAHFPPGTVGYSVHNSIGLIQTLLHDYGQARIGELFNRPDVQELLGRENTLENNQRVAQLEYDYWMDIVLDPTQTRENRIGGLLGVTFNPEVRTNVQMRVGEGAEWLSDNWNYAVNYVIDPAILAIQDGVEQVNAFAQHRIDYLKRVFPANGN